MKRVALFFGGLSNEAEVSIISATNVVANFDYSKYKLSLVYWHSDGYFYLLPDMESRKSLKQKMRLAVEDFSKRFDLALLMTHGRYGEDGILQSILESQRLPYSGAGILASALCMDKMIFKEMMKGAGLPQLPFVSFDYKRQSETEIKTLISQAKKKLSLPIYIKPANSGSSVGISRVSSWKDLAKALKEAKKHDHKIVIEEGLSGHREIEVAVLGNDKLLISDLGELVLAQDFYDFEEKYKKGRTEFLVPAPLSASLRKKIKDLAKKAYELADVRGFARVDFFLAKNKVYLNEINTLPGFTDISMYPRLMKSAGISYKNLINRLIQLAKLDN